MTRRYPALLLLLVLGCSCARGSPTTEQGVKTDMADAIKATEAAKTFSFTLDGSGEVTRAGKKEGLFFGGNGVVAFPSSVRMTVNIDQPTGGVRSELMHIGGILYVRPGSPADAQWRRSTTAVGLAGFDPLATFDLKTLSQTQKTEQLGATTLDGIRARRVRLTPTEGFRAEAQKKLPAGFENTRLDIRQDVWIARGSGRIIRVVQRFDYSGQAMGFFETDLILSDFGGEARIVKPAASEISDEPLQVNATPAPR